VIEGPAKEYGGAFYTSYRLPDKPVAFGEQIDLL
jgi:hypothetical protein